MRTLMLNRDFVSPFLRMARELDNLDYGCNHNNLLNPLTP